MCPPPDKKPRKAPVGRKKATLANYRVMQEINQARIDRHLSLRQVARELGYHNASRVGKYFRQQIFAGPEMVRKLAIAVGMSPIDALWRAQRYSEVFRYLERLYRLGWFWMHQDSVGLDRHSGAIFMTFWQGVRDADINEVPPPLAHRYTQATVYNKAGIFRVISLPRPMACAILLGIGMFPRRGEALRPEASTLLEKLSFVASDMSPLADRARMPSNYVSFTRPLKDAEKILPWGMYGWARLAVVAEYVHSWCDFACSGYADYARVALYERGAFVRKPSENEDLWAWQRAEIPTIDELKITQDH